MKFKFNATKLVKGLASMEVKSRAAVGLYGSSVASQMEAYAKSNRAWNDITGQARGTLNAKGAWLGNKYRITLSHGVYYGVYLELCNERRYAIVKPTIDYISPRAISGLGRILK